MNEAYVNDLEYEAQSSGGLLDWLKAGADIYKSVTPPATPAPPPAPTQPVGQARFSPWLIGGAVVALVAGLWLALRK